jgi:preprotein translocase subunit Sss1
MKEVNKMEEIREKEKQELTEKIKKFYAYPFFVAMSEPDSKEFKKFVKKDIIGSIIVAIIAIVVISWLLFGDNISILSGDKIALKIQKDDAFEFKLLFIFFIIFMFISFIRTVARIYYFWGHWEHFWVKYSKPMTLKILKDILKDLKKDNLI